MKIYLCLIFFTFAQSVVVGIYFGNLKCTRDPNDSTSCTYNDVSDSHDLYSSLADLSDPDKLLIKKLKLVNAKLTHLPKELTTTYANVEDLDISNSQLWRFVRIDFGSDTKIKRLNSSNNKVHWLTTEMCKGMKQLENLDLSYNTIDRIEMDAFIYNENFKYLNLSNNRIGKLTENFFNAVRSLEILRLNDNKISSIVGNFDDIDMNLKEVHIQNNHLLTFDPTLIKSTLYFDISWNNLEGEMSFEASKMNELYIRGNSFSVLTINKNLQKLDASDNTERSFTINFGNNFALSYLDLSNLDIVLYDDILASIRQRHFLKYLDLSENNLEEVDFKSIEFPQTLEVLNLKRTDLHTLRHWDYLRNFLPKLKELNILDNFLSCTELPTIIKSLTDMNVNVTGLIVGKNDEFVSKNCAAENHRKRNPGRFVVAGDGGNKMLWTLVIICILGYVVGAGYYFNRKYDLIDKVRGRGRSSGIANPGLIGNTQLID